MGTFWIKETTAGFRFELRADNGSVVATSGLYRSRAACRKGIESVVRCCLAHLEDQTEEDCDIEKNPKFELFRDGERRFRFRLRARNGAVIVSGGSYRAKASCLDGIASVRRSARKAEVWEE